MGLIFNRPTKIQRFFSVSPEIENVKQRNQSTTIDPNKRLAELLDLFHQHKFKVVLIFGTALGAYRDQKIIPHDTDIDLGFYENDMQRLKDFFPILEKKGFYVRSLSPFNLAMEMMGCPNMHVDLYLLKKPGFPYSWIGKKWFCDHALFTSDYFNPKTLKKAPCFKGQYWMPSPPEAYLEELYGKTWRVPLKSLNAIYRSALSQWLNALFFDTEQPLRFAGLHRHMVFKPWVSRLLKTCLPNAKITNAYRHPE
jgi:hypothetical protein